LKTAIINARVLDPVSGRDKAGSIYIADGKIAALDKAPDGFRADETFDAKGLAACPGLVDLSARLREPGFEYKATLESEMRAAAAGGVTTLACPPDTDPPLDEPGLVEMLTRRAESLACTRVHPLGALTVGLAGEHAMERVVTVVFDVTGEVFAEIVAGENQSAASVFLFAEAEEIGGVAGRDGEFIGHCPYLAPTRCQPSRI